MRSFTFFLPFLMPTEGERERERERDRERERERERESGGDKARPACAV
jgi:hypothetical protein